MKRVDVGGAVGGASGNSPAALGAVAERELGTLRPGCTYATLLRTLNRHLDNPEIGRDPFADHAQVVVTHRPGFKAASAEVSGLHLEARALLAGRDRVVVDNERLAMFAPVGVMPIDYTEHAVHEERHRQSTAFRDFINLGLSRLALLDYRAWAQLHPSASADRPSRDHFLAKLLCLTGISPGHGETLGAERARASWPLAYLGLRRSARHLAAIVQAVVGLPARVIERDPRWRATGHEAGRLSHALGQLGATALGKRYFDRQHGVELVLGPVDGETFRRCDADRATIDRLCDVVHDFERGKFDARICVEVDIKPSDSASLGAQTARLGRSWLAIRDGDGRAPSPSKICIAETGNCRGH